MGGELVFINSTGDTFTPTQSGAIATWVWEMARASQRFGLEPWVITRSASVDAYPWVRTVELPYPFPPAIRGAGRCFAWLGRRNGWQHVRQDKWVELLVRTIRKRGWHSSTLVFHNDPEAVSAVRASLPNARLIHLFHNANPCLSPWRERFASSVDVALAVSAYCARANESQFGCAVHILRNGVDPERFLPISKPEGRRPIIGFVGRTDRQKAPDLLLRAATKLAESGSKFDLQLLGSRFYGSHQSDPYQEALHQSAERLESIGVRVDRPGFASRLALPRLLAQSDIHVVPSRWEDPCPLTVLEGMSTGQATVASACGGVPELVGGAGFLFERDDVGGLEARLRVLLENDELRLSYGRRARERALQRPWAVVMGELLEIINFQ